MSEAKKAMECYQVAQMQIRLSHELKDPYSHLQALILVRLICCLNRENYERSDFLPNESSLNLKKFF